MRQEDKEVDGRDLEHAEERRRESELVEEDDGELHDLDGRPELVRDHERSLLVADTMQRVLRGEHVLLHTLALEKHEARALEAIKTAVDGRDQSINGFVFAEDRRALLEQALAVLQPELANLGELGDTYEELVHQVADLRGHLKNLEDAQEELEHRDGAAVTGEAPDSDDKPKPDDDQSLTGPERKVDKAGTSLTGTERKVDKPETSLTGAERKVDKPASSLGGPERKEEPKPVTTLGDAKEIAAIAAKPYWKKSAGG